MATVITVGDSAWMPSKDGGWGPVVITGVETAADGRRQTTLPVSVNAVELLVNCALIAAAARHRAADLGNGSDAGHAEPSPHERVVRLIVGGVLAAPLAGYVTPIIQARSLMALVGVTDQTLLGANQVLRLIRDRARVTQEQGEAKPLAMRQLPAY